jgi:hypothetical protein
MFCGILDEMKTTIIIFIALVFLSIIVYFFNDKIQYLENTVARQNQVLSEFISNVQRDLAYSSCLGVSNLSSDVKVVKSDEVDKIVISEDEYESDSDDDSDSDSDDDDDSDSDSESDDECAREDGDKKNIKVIELVDNEEKVEEVNVSLSNDLSSTIKKIELVHKEEKSGEDNTDSANSSANADGGDSDVVGSKKMSVAELRAAVVAKGLANTASANKMKKLELVEALSKL